ncbi:MAG: hypothetical protein Q8K93_34760, partial [Reyranella sp.]|nr:hypothetical protein [Reyranella sp.]
MKSGSRIFRRMDAFPFVLVALALAMRLAFAPGYMVTAAPEGVAVVICTGDGAVTRIIDTEPSGVPQPSDDGHQPHQSPCAFALAGAVLGPPSAVVIPVATLTRAPAAMSPPAFSPGRRSTALPPPAT